MGVTLPTHPISTSLKRSATRCRILYSYGTEVYDTSCYYASSWNYNANSSMTSLNCSFSPQATNLTSSHLRIIKLISTMLLLAHWSGCIQYFIPYLQDFPPRSWVAKENLLVRISLFSLLTGTYCHHYFLWHSMYTALTNHRTLSPFVCHLHYSLDPSRHAHSAQK